jgi:hypothetical protein
MAVIPLSDASRRPTRFPVVTATIILINVLVFLVELAGGEPFVTRWSVIPAEIVAGHHWITVLTAMFMHGSWSHLLGNMVFLWAFGPEVEDLMDPRRYLAFYLLGGAGRDLGAVGGRPQLHRSQPRRERCDCRRDGGLPGHLPSGQDSLAPPDLRIRAGRLHPGGCPDRRLDSHPVREPWRGSADAPTGRRGGLRGPCRWLHLRGHHHAALRGPAATHGAAS